MCAGVCVCVCMCVCARSVCVCMCVHVCVHVGESVSAVCLKTHQHTTGLPVRKHEWA